MAEVAGLSLAANIFQFLEYGVKFVDMAWKIYGSGPDSIDGFRSLQKLSRDLESVTQGLEKQSPSPSRQPSETRGINNQALSDATEECRAVSREVLASFCDIGLFSHRKPKRREALRTAFKLRWNEDRIRTLSRRLEGCRSQLILSLLASLR